MSRSTAHERDGFSHTSPEALDNPNSSSLLLDMGSSFAKGVVLDGSNGRNVAQAEEAMPSDTARSDTRHELDPKAVLAVLGDVVRQLLVSCDVQPGKVILSTQMHSCLLTDAANQPVSPVITWQDNRLLESHSDGRTHLERLRSIADLSAWRRSGMAERPGFGAGNLGLWLRANHESATGLRVHTLGSYVSTAWGGPYVTGWSNAAALGILDLADHAWSEPLILLHGLAGCELPAIVDEGVPAGSVHIVGAQRTWLGDVGDHQASVLGSGGLDDDEVAISLGTAGIAARLADSPSDDPRVDTRPYFGGRFLVAVSRQPGGALASEFARMLAELGGRLNNSQMSVDAVWQTLAGLPVPDIPNADLELSETAAGKRELSLAGIRPSMALDSVYAGFMNHYVNAYRESIEMLFPHGHPVARRLKFNGGVASRHRGFQTALTDRLGLEVSPVPDGDLALLGLAELMTTTSAR